MKNLLLVFAVYLNDLTHFHNFATITVSLSGMIEYLLLLFYVIIFLFIIKKSYFFISSNISFRTMALIFIIKILCGIMLSYIYTYFYTDRSTADVFKYFDDSKIMFDALYTKPLDFFKMLFGINNNSLYFDQTYYKVMNNWYRVHESNLYNESHTIIRINAVIRIFSFGYYQVHTAFMCFFSFTGLVALYKATSKRIKGKEMELVLGIFMLPSVLFWGSGVLKEGILFFGIGFLVLYFFKLIGKFSFNALFWVLLSIVLIYYTKMYILMTAIPVLTAFLWCEYTKNKYPLFKYSLVLIVFTLIVINLKYFFPSFNLLDIMVTKQRDFIGLAKEVKSGSYFEIPVLTPDLFSFVRNAPLAFFNTYFRPFIFESTSLLIIIAAIENLLITTLTF